MSIRWRKNPDGQTQTAYIDITIQGCQRVRESTGIRSDQPNARKAAKEYHDRIKADLWRQAKYGEQPVRLWDDLLLKWVSEHSHKKSIETDKGRLRWLWPHLKSVRLELIDRDMVDVLLCKKEAEGVSPATVNRYAALIRSMLRAAHLEYGWIQQAPKVRMRPENNEKFVWMTRQETDMLISDLRRTADHVADAVVLSLATGLRESNVAHLKWEQIEMDRAAMYVYKMKNGRPLGTPLNADAMEILQRRQGIHDQYVFSWRGHPVTRFNNTSWGKSLPRVLARIALKSNGLPDRLDGFTWHSLRHTWATWMAQANCPMEKLQKLGGWQDLTMVMRYSHFSTDYLAQFSELSARDHPPLKVVG